MASTAVLRSRQPLLHHHNPFHAQSFHSLPFKPPRPNPNPMRPRRRKRSSPLGSPDQIRGGLDDRATVEKFPAKNFLTGQVKILKRGEELTAQPPPAAAAKPKKKNDRQIVGGDYDDLVLCSTDRLGPEPETVQKQIRISDLNVYAGSAASLASPPPSSLPFPAFFAKKETNKAATSDIRRLLGLDLA